MEGGGSGGEKIQDFFFFFKDERESKRGRCGLNLKRCEV